MILGILIPDHEKADTLRIGMCTFLHSALSHFEWPEPVPVLRVNLTHERGLMMMCLLPFSPFLHPHGSLQLGLEFDPETVGRSINVGVVCGDLANI